jgi:hypothetical protein
MSADNPPPLVYHPARRRPAADSRDVERAVAGALTVVAGVVVLGFLVAGLVLAGRAEVSGCEYTGESSAVATATGVQTAYRYRCNGVDRYSSVVPPGP